jgi:hypothetical protein
MSFFARHAFHISVPDPYRFEYGSSFADLYRIPILILISGFQDANKK